MNSQNIPTALLTLQNVFNSYMTASLDHMNIEQKKAHFFAAKVALLRLIDESTKYSGVNLNGLDIVIEQLTKFWDSISQSEPSCFIHDQIEDKSMDVQYVFLDTETTGLNRDNNDEVLEIAIVGLSGETLLNTLVRPIHRKTWSDAQAIHGITPDDVASAPTWAELLPQIAAICEGKTVVIYNATFDMSFFPERFFAAAECAMQRFAELNDDGGSHRWVGLEIAATASGYGSTGTYHRALEDAKACRHIWLFGIPELEKRYPKVINPYARAVWERVGGSCGGNCVNVFDENLINEDGKPSPIEFVFSDLFANELRYVSVGCRVDLWTRQDIEYINAYRQDAEYGCGKIAELAKHENPTLTSLMHLGHPAWMVVTARYGDGFSFVTHVDRDKIIHRGIKINVDEFTTSFEYSDINEDIYKCFISNKTHMGVTGIGTLEQFTKVEEQISTICQKKNGRYYKSQAKAAKFAIIFCPYNRTYSNITSLKSKGYKVITFEKALEYFGLLDMWNCKGHAAFENGIKSICSQAIGVKS